MTANSAHDDKQSSVNAEGILSDARLLAKAAFQLGKLADNKLHETIIDAESSLDDSEKFGQKIGLVRQESIKVLQNMVPISYYDLKYSWIDGSGFRSPKINLTIIGILTLVLLIGTAYVTSLYNRAVAARAEAIELQRFPIIETTVRIFDIARLHSAQFLASANATPSPIPLAFHQSVRDGARHASRVDVLERELSQIYHEMQFVQGLEFWGWPRGVGSPPQGPPRAGQPTGGSDPGRGAVAQSAPPPSARGADLNPRSQVPDNERQTTTLDTCSDENLRRVLVDLYADRSNSHDAKPNQNYIIDLRLYRFELLRLFCQVGMLHILRLHEHSFDSLVKAIDPGLDLLRSWILPALYGALGTALFFIRRLTNPNLPNPELPRVFFRIFVGAFAGVVFAWVWIMFSVPAQTTTAAASAVAGPGPFLLAFLVGYSTDLLFQALDQAVDGISKRISGKAER